MMYRKQVAKQTASKRDFVKVEKVLEAGQGAEKK
jgi:hypothetical protein